MPIPHRTDLPPVRTAGDLTDRWQLLAADDTPDPSFRTDLWVQLFEADGRQCAPLVVVEGIPVNPERPVTVNLAGVLWHLLQQHTAGAGTVAFAFSRRLPADVQASDLEWAQDLAAACAAEGVDVLGVHLVNGPDVRCVA